MGSMAGKVKAFPDAGTPSQQWVDSSLQYLEDTKTTIEDIDVKTLTQQGRQHAVQIMNEKTEEVVQKQSEQSENKLLKTAKEYSQKFSQMFELIQPIITMNISSDTVVKWAKAVVKYFGKQYLQYFKPYEKLMVLIMFATQYQIVFTQECAEILNALQQKINQLMQMKSFLGQAEAAQVEKLKEKIKEAQERNKGLIKLTQTEIEQMRGKLERQKELAETVVSMMNEEK